MAAREPSEFQNAIRTAPGASGVEDDQPVGPDARAAIADLHDRVSAASRPGEVERPSRRTKSLPDPVIL